MATLYPEGFDPTSQSDYRPATAQSGKATTQRERRTAEYYYLMVGTEAAADIIQLGLGSGQKFPKGTTVDAAYVEAFSETDIAVTATGHIGDLDTLAASAAYPDAAAYAVAHIASDADRYAVSLALSAVGRQVAANGVAIAIPHTLQIDCYLTFTFATLSTPAAGGKLRIRIPYFLTA